MPARPRGAPAIPARELAATAAVFNAGGEILLVRLSYDQRQWALPGGRIEPHESPAEAAIREAREETGLEVEVEAFYGVYWLRERDSMVFAFRCRATGGALAPDGGEIVEARYFAPGALPRPITNGTLLRVADACSAGPAALRVLERLEYLR